jgi:hypothetical protein
MSEKTPSWKSPIEVFCRAAELGLKLGTRPGGKLTVEPVERCPKEFLETLRESKGWLLIMLRWPFVMVHSKVLEETIFFCDDDATKLCLIESGAPPHSVYTRSDLLALLKHHRQTPLTALELLRIHHAKRIFGGRIAC